MVRLLKGLLGKSRKAIVVNGKLLASDRHPILASLNNYRVEFMVSGTNQILEQGQGIGFIIDALSLFNSEFGALVGNNSDKLDHIEAYVDQFTGAVIIESYVYQMLRDKTQHQAGIQHTAANAQFLREFILKYTQNYMDLYLFLFHRRIAAQHMSILVRSHFVSGFYQPVLVETQGVFSPFLYGENEWCHTWFGASEKHLEYPSDFSRKLELSCVAMCDIATLFGCKVVPGLERDKWMFMCLLVALSQLDKDRSREFSTRYGRYFQEIVDNEQTKELLTRMMLQADKARTALRMV